MGPGGFFPTNPDLADILGRTDLDFENFYFFDFLGPKFLAWAHLGPAWAHPLGPRVGSPTWAQLGPIHLGPDAAAGAAAGRILKSRSRPLPTHPGMKYFRKETLAVDIGT